MSVILSPWSMINSHGGKVRGGSSSAWTPAQLAGLLAWYKADAGVSTSGSNVTTWADQSGNGYTLTGTASHQPTFNATGFNGKATVTFSTSVNTVCTTASAVALATAGITSCFMALSTTGSSNVLARAAGYDGNSSGDFTGANSCGYFINDNNSLIASAFHGSFLATQTLVASTNYRYGTTFDGSNNIVYLNNSGSASTGYSAFTFNTNGSIIIGCNNSFANAFDGNISEIIITNTLVSSLDRTNIDNYLRSHWGI